MSCFISRDGYVIHYDLNTIQVFNHLVQLEDFWGTFYAEGQPCEPVTTNRPFSKMAAEISNTSKLKTYTSTRERESTFTLVTLQSFSISGVISAEKM